MDSIERLTALFERFPGIGPRQAGRFVQYLLRSSPALRRELVDAVQALGSAVRQCAMCFLFFSGSARVCDICASDERDHTYLAVVASDADLAALERSGTYRGLYFVLGGTISLASEKANGLRIKQLLDSIPKRAEKGLKEIIVAFPANPEGDATAERIREEFRNQQGFTLLVSALGRGLSTGSELEYADPETIKSAFESRR
ncbi:MAG TPA: toprim domain-containing protein [Candidatus Paceibacterota bacterium]